MGTLDTIYGSNGNAYRAKLVEKLSSRRDSVSVAQLLEHLTSNQKVLVQIQAGTNIFFL